MNKKVVRKMFGSEKYLPKIHLEKKKNEESLSLVSLSVSHKPC